MNTLPALIVRILLLAVVAIGIAVIGFGDAKTGTIMLATFWTAILLGVITGTQIVSHIRRPPPPMPKPRPRPASSLDQTRRFMEGNGAQLTGAERMRRSINADMAEMDRKRPLPPPWPTNKEPSMERTWPVRRPKPRHTPGE